MLIACLTMSKTKEELYKLKADYWEARCKVLEKFMEEKKCYIPKKAFELYTQWNELKSEEKYYNQKIK